MGLETDRATVNYVCTTHIRTYVPAFYIYCVRVHKTHHLTVPGFVHSAVGDGGDVLSSCCWSSAPSRLSQTGAMYI